MRAQVKTGLLASLIAITVAAFPAAASASVERSGYIPMVDGVQLKYTVHLPSPDGRFPVALVYDPYCSGDGAQSCADGAPNTSPALLAAGYAVVGVAARGTGCSGGTFEPLTRVEGSDGATAVEWAAGQPWSDGHVGMFGASYPGITQLEVAALRPPHLDAISPFHVVADTYRDVGYPGGIFNAGFASLWSLALEPADSNRSAATAAEQQDPVCTRNLAEHAAMQPTANPFPSFARHPFDDAFWAARAPGAGAANIDIPVLGCVAWQDGDVSSRMGDSYINQLDPARAWVVAMNGYHDVCDDVPGGRMVEVVRRFLDRFVKGEPNGFEQTPHVQIWHETQNAGSDHAPRWITTASSWRLPVTPVPLYFTSGGVLVASAPVGAQSPDSYRYPLPASGNEDGTLAGQTNQQWKVPDAPGGSLSYTTPRLAHDAEFFGTGSIDLWLKSTAADTDLQVTLTEVRPDGQETYIERGWLRASHRRLDPTRSTELLPYQTHQPADARELEPGKPTYMRVELFPFDHVFRAGSAIRLWIDAPTANTGFYTFNYLKTPAINTVLHDSAHPSRIVLGHLPGGNAQGTMLPACDTLLNQPCRSNPIPVPTGSISVTSRVVG